MGPLSISMRWWKPERTRPSSSIPSAMTGECSNREKGQIGEAADEFMVISYNPGYQSVLKDLKQYEAAIHGD